MFFIAVWTSQTYCNFVLDQFARGIIVRPTEYYTRLHRKYIYIGGVQKLDVDSYYVEKYKKPFRILVLFYLTLSVMISGKIFFVYYTLDWNGSNYLFLYIF